MTNFSLKTNGYSILKKLIPLLDCLMTAFRAYAKHFVHATRCTRYSPCATDIFELISNGLWDLDFLNAEGKRFRPNNKIAKFCLPC